MKQKSFSYAKWGYIFSLPFVIAFLLFTLYPVIYTLFIGFTDLQGIIHPDTKILDNPFQNFQDILGSPVFQTALKNTFVIWIWNFIPQMALALLLAAWFTNNRMKLKGKGFFKVIFYMPNIITAATVAILFNTLFAYPKGPINDILMALKLISDPYQFSQDGMASKLIVAFIQFWMWYGYTMIVLIAGILGISPELFEAADIDGANGMQKFLYVTIPNLKTILLFTLVTSLIGGLQMFDIPKLFLNGGPNNATLTASVFIQNQAFSGSYMYNRAAAASMIMFLIIAVLSAIMFFVMRDKDEVALHKIVKAQEKAYKKKMKEQKMAGGGK
ncbi:MAG: sugar ABC transporter permease [Roseburia sp.]|nr:sugar ABC transporter permease [Roseburia sp.]